MLVETLKSEGPLMSNFPEISAIIVNFNTREMTLKCLRTLLSALEGLRAEVIVVDNASTDGSVESIRREFPDIRLLASENNSGFGVANNQAMKIAKGRFFLLLNSDAFPEKNRDRHASGLH